jgi:hypothetical protein
MKNKFKDTTFDIKILMSKYYFFQYLIKYKQKLKHNYPKFESNIFLRLYKRKMLTRALVKKANII